MFPVIEMCTACRERGVISIVDGAHSPGQVQLDLDLIKPDFFTGKRAMIKNEHYDETKLASIQ